MLHPDGGKDGELDYTTKNIHRKNQCILHDNKTVIQNTSPLISLYTFIKERKFCINYLSVL